MSLFLCKCRLLTQGQDRFLVRLVAKPSRRSKDWWYINECTQVNSFVEAFQDFLRNYTLLMFSGSPLTDILTPIPPPPQKTWKEGKEAATFLKVEEFSGYSQIRFNGSRFNDKLRFNDLFAADQVYVYVVAKSLDMIRFSYIFPADGLHR